MNTTNPQPPYTGAANVTPQPEPLWKVRDVAKYLSMSVSYVYKLVEAGDLPCVRLGAAVRFQPAAIRAHVERMARASAGGNVVPLRREEG